MSTSDYLEADYVHTSLRYPESIWNQRIKNVVPIFQGKRGQNDKPGQNMGYTTWEAIRTMDTEAAIRIDRDVHKIFANFS